MDWFGIDRIGRQENGGDTMREMVRDFSITMICFFLSFALLANRSEDVFLHALQAGGILLLWQSLEAMMLPDDFYE